MLKRFLLAILVSSTLMGADLRFLKKGDKGEIMMVDLSSVRIRRGLMYFETITKDPSGVSILVIAYDPDTHKSRLIAFRWHKPDGTVLKDDNETPWQVVESGSAIDLAINLIIRQPEK